MSLPGWLDPLWTTDELRAADAWAVAEAGIPSLELMEAAGTALAELTEERVPHGRIVVACGGGNNGGDGLVAARALHAHGREVDVRMIGDPERLRGDAAENLRRLDGIPAAPWDPAALDGAAAIVDALLGTGFSGAPREPLRGAIEAINAAGAVVVAADVPSGVDASTGTIADVAVRADVTATFHRAKPGLWINPGKRHAGDAWRVDIGIPAAAPAAPAVGLIGNRVRDLIPPRTAGSSKFTEGIVLVAGGSAGLTGAPCLAAEAAMRAGAGYVTVCVPQSLEMVFELRLLEAMTVALPDRAGAHTPEGVDLLSDLLARADALVLGPGLGRSEPAVLFARSLAAWAEVPLVLDADGLNAHAERLEQLDARSAPTVLTPHDGELARLLGVDRAAIEAGRLQHARTAAARAGAIVVLKGDDTLVAAPDGRVAVSPGNCPALATAGTGDVLAGTIGAILAKGVPAWEAACAGVWLHARAARHAAAPHGPDAVIAGDVIAALPAALAR